MKEIQRSHLVVFSDASDVAAGAFTVEICNKVFHRMWEKHEAKMSSTWRELKAIELALLSFKDDLTSKSLKWFTDNQSCVKIIQSGSMKRHLQEIAFSIFSMCFSSNISLDISWIPREQNLQADYLSKIVDAEDWGVTKDFFVFMDNLWGAHTIDRFASCRNNKLNRFNSLFWNPTCEAVDCFSQSWQNENNWFVPPISLVCRCIRYVLFCKASGTLIVPKWKSADFWPMIFKNENETHYYVRDVLEFRSPENIYEQGQNKNSIFGSERFSSPVLAVRLDAS